MIEKRKYELEVLEQKSKHVEDFLESIKKLDASRPDVRFYEGPEGIKQMLEDTLKSKKEVLVFSYIELLAERIGADYLESYFKKRSSKKIHTRLILPPCPFAKRVEKNAAAYKIQIRYLPKEYQWSAGCFLWDDTVALLSYTEGKVTCTFLENKDLADFFRNIIFELCWNSAKPKVC